MVKSLEETMPVIGFIDLVGVSEDNLCDIRYKLRNVIIKPNSAEEHSIFVEIEYEVFCNCFENKKINIIQDMYSPSMNITFTENKVNTMVDMKNTIDTLNIKEKMRLEDPEHTKLCTAQITPIINNINVANENVNIDGDLDLNLILTNDMGDSVISYRTKLPFDLMQDIKGVTGNSKINIEITPMTREFIIDDMEITAKIDLSVCTNSYNLETVNVIENIEELPEFDENPYSMVIYFVKPGDTLWKIAKKYKSTISDIARINNIENPDSIDVGMQLFIPKSNMCRT